ncbi:MAG: tyrosine-protein phosphatase [Dehalococcoidia bacterium]
MTRHLAWDGCFNARDLGGWCTVDGRRVTWGQLIRSDALDHLTPAGWDAVMAYGIRTVIDLRSDVERPSKPIALPAGLTAIHVPLEDLTDAEFWEEWLGHTHSPHYYAAFVARYPTRLAAVIRAVAQAQPGGVVIHCAVGRDRTGLVSILLLALVGVLPADIIADYALTAERLHLIYANETRAAALQAAGQRVLAQIRAHGARLSIDGNTPPVVRSPATDRDGILHLLETVNVESLLLSGGLTTAEIKAVCDRLLGAKSARECRSGDGRREP